MDHVPDGRARRQRRRLLHRLRPQGRGAADQQDRPGRRRPADPARAYGRTWFSLFSPRIEKYTVGIEPATPGWAGPATAPTPVVDASRLVRRDARAGRQSLFRRPVRVRRRRRPGCGGCRSRCGPPRAFKADWAAPLDKDKPAVENRLRHPPGRPDELIGVGHQPAAGGAGRRDPDLPRRGRCPGPLLPDTAQDGDGPSRLKFSACGRASRAAADGTPGGDDRGGDRLRLGLALSRGAGTVGRSRATGRCGTWTSPGGWPTTTATR